MRTIRCCLFLAVAMISAMLPAMAQNLNAGYLYVLNENGGNTNITVYSSPLLNPTKMQTISAFDDARGFVFDKRGNLYVVDAKKNEVLEFSPRADPIVSLPDHTANTGAGPNAIAVDDAGNLYVACEGADNQVDVFATSADGNMTRTKTLGEGNGIVAPFDVVVTPGISVDVYTLSSKDGTLVRYPTSFASPTGWKGVPTNTNGQAAYLQSHPGRSLAINNCRTPNDCRVYVQANDGDDIYYYDSSNTQSEINLGQQAYALGWAFDDSDNLYVASAGSVKSPPCHGTPPGSGGMVMQFTPSATAHDPANACIRNLAGPDALALWKDLLFVAEYGGDRVSYYRIPEAANLDFVYMGAISDGVHQPAAIEFAP